ncbi:MAG: Stk1 family PASTA domain-containing Ser/Thr kinase [Actinomycetota bacterium]|nr:Stk1 family PASTA domain-containing Ser/Thr kinase [Actinomycetota bacterium]
MGEVYRARDSVLGRDVAIKVLHRNLAGDPGFIDRFRREARAAALLSHPNIVAVHDWGSTTSGTYFMVMEFVRGRNVRDLLSHHKRLAPAQAVEIMDQMLAALDHAHRHGIVHRDVKPENVLVTADGTVKVADFGLARAFAESRVSQAPGTVTGTVQYLAPEQIQGNPADPRTDVYALGIVGYELLTGRVPFTGETSLAIAYRHLQDPVPPPSRTSPAVPEALDRIILRATEKDRERRPASAEDLRRELHAVAPSLPAAPPLAQLVRDLPASTTTGDDRASTVTIPRTLSPRVRRRRVRLRLLATLALVLALAGGAWAAWAYLVPHYTHVPNVARLSRGIAERRVESAGLHAQFGQPITSTTVPAGDVVRQSVASGTKIRKGSEVVLRLSAGLPLRTVPSVTGKKAAVAAKALVHAGLKIHVVRVFDDRVPDGRVVDQNPSSGQTIQYGSVVKLTVSKGPQPIDIPDVTGQSGGDAEAILVAAGFKVDLHHLYSTTVLSGRVIRQEPSGGTASAGSHVTLWVSLGPRTFPMPRVIGMATDTAKSQLENLGLKVQVVIVPNSLGKTVVSQFPSAGKTVQQGQQVAIYVA